MTNPKEKQNQTAKRGCLFLLVGTPFLLLVYLLLLATDIFDSKPASYPDLEIQPEGTVIPFMEALASCPEWPAWKASEDARSGLFSEIEYALQGNEAVDPAQLAKARVEIERGLAIIDCLLAKDGSFGRAKGGDMEARIGEGVTETSVLFKNAKWAILLGESNADGEEGAPTVGAHALRLVAKTRPMADSLIGLVVWMSSESAAHEICLGAVHTLAERADGAGLRKLLGELEATRPKRDRVLTRALGGDLPVLRFYLALSRSRLGSFESGGLLFGFGFKADDLLGEWILLRTQTNRSVDLAAARTRAILAQTALPARDRRYPTVEEPGLVDHLSLAPNAGGEILITMGRDPTLKAIERHDMNLARHHLIRLLIALALYRVDHSSALPADLQALVPGYLPELPKDPYTGDPPIYDAVAGKLAFRGTDFVPATVPMPPEEEGARRHQARPPGVVGLFAPEGAHDPGVDLKAFFAMEAEPEN